MKAANLKYDDIKEGEVYTFKRKIIRSDVMAFAGLSGDFNPLLVDEEFGSKSQFRRNIVHGMLAGSFFSALVGMYCPGEKCLYLNQTLNFKAPLFYDDEVEIRGTVMNKSDGIKLITLKTEILKEGDVKIFGEAKVRVIDNE